MADLRIYLLKTLHFTEEEIEVQKINMDTAFFLNKPLILSKNKITTTTIRKY